MTEMWIHLGTDDEDVISVMLTEEQRAELERRMDRCTDGDHLSLTLVGVGAKVTTRTLSANVFYAEKV